MAPQLRNLKALQSPLGPRPSPPKAKEKGAWLPHPPRRGRGGGACSQELQKSLAHTLAAKAYPTQAVLAARIGVFQTQPEEAISYDL